MLSSSATVKEQLTICNILILQVSAAESSFAEAFAGNPSFEGLKNTGGEWNTCTKESDGNFNTIEVGEAGLELQQHPEVTATSVAAPEAKPTFGTEEDFARA